jgi:hypothetical protein
MASRFIGDHTGYVEASATLPQAVSSDFVEGVKESRCVLAAVTEQLES